MKATLLVLSLLSLSDLSLGQAASYAPTLVTCPAGSLITRSGSPLVGTQQLDPSENAFISNRRANITPSLWNGYLSNNSTGVTGYNVSQLLTAANLPRLATAVSGGGLRASLYGAGTLSALDARNSSSAGPLFQLCDYISGLSGGSWTVGSLALNGYPDLYSLVMGTNGQPGWLLSVDILDPGGLANQTLDTEYYTNLLTDVGLKGAYGFPVSLEDVWGRALAYHFFNGTNVTNFYTNTTHSNGLLFSSAKLYPNFASNPLPIIVATSRVAAPSNTSSASTPLIPLSNTQFEFTPFTFGSFDPTLQAHVPIEYAGTFLSNGTPSSNTSCVNGYQNAGFVLGSSAGLFNALTGNIGDPTVSTLITILTGEIAKLQKSNNSVELVANWPNSFYNFSPSANTTFESSGDLVLQVTDGGEDGENVPIAPLLVRSRGVDTIIAVDSSADTNQSWPDGTSLIATSYRIAAWKNFSSFPPVPQTTDLYISQGLNTRPTFFGCNISGNGTASVLGNYPLVVWLPNAPSTNGSYLTNTSTFQLSYTNADTLSFLDAAHANTLKGYPTGNQTSDPDWPLCLKCALVERARKRASLNRTASCQTCLSKYCWAGDTTLDVVPGSASSSGGGSGGTKPASATSLRGGTTALIGGITVILVAIWMVGI